VVVPYDEELYAVLGDVEEAKNSTHQLATAPGRLSKP